MSAKDILKRQTQTMLNCIFLVGSQSIKKLDTHTHTHYILDSENDYGTRTAFEEIKNICG
jgi:hypothetical protein